MKNLESMTALSTANRSLYFILRMTLKSYIAQLDKCIHDEVAYGSNDPTASAQKLVDEIGKSAAQFILASVINAKAWDGRISKDNAVWAAGIEDALDEASVRKLGMTCNAHPSHIDSIVSAFRKL